MRGTPWRDLARRQGAGAGCCLARDAVAGAAAGGGAPPPAPAGARVRPWLVGAVLGRGGMGTVFRARDDAARFAREVRLGARVRHPHLLPVLDALHEEAHASLMMPLVDGETPRARLDREGRLPVGEAVRLALALADALAALHAAGVVRRDFERENVLLARSAVADVPPSADGAADVWALGVVPHGMRAGQPPLRRWERRSARCGGSSRSARRRRDRLRADSPYR